MKPRIRLNWTGPGCKVAAIQVRAKEQHQDLRKQTKCIKSLQDIARSIGDDDEKQRLHQLIHVSYRFQSESVVTKKSSNLETQQSGAELLEMLMQHTSKRQLEGAHKRVTTYLRSSCMSSRVRSCRHQGQRDVRAKW